MRVIKVMLSDIESITFDLGFVGEKNHTCVMINCVSLFNQYPDAVATMVAKPPVGDIYPVILHRNGVFVIWNVSESDIANAGSGQYQLTFTDGEGDNAEIIKTVYGSFSVEPSMVSNGEAPDPIEDWLGEANEALAEFGKINELSASATTLAAGSEATVEITNVNGHKNIAIGVPKGDKGDKGDDGDPAPAEEVTAAVDAYLAENFSNPSNPPLDRSLSSSSSAAPADLVGNLKSAISDIKEQECLFTEDDFAIGGWGVDSQQVFKRFVTPTYSCSVNPIEYPIDKVLHIKEGYEVYAFYGNVGHAWTSTDFIIPANTTAYLNVRRTDYETSGDAVISVFKKAIWVDTETEEEENLLNMLAEQEIHAGTGYYDASGNYVKNNADFSSSNKIEINGAGVARIEIEFASAVTSFVYCSFFKNDGTFERQTLLYQVSVTSFKRNVNVPSNVKQIVFSWKHTGVSANVHIYKYKVGQTETDIVLAPFNKFADVSVDLVNGFYDSTPKFVSSTAYKTTEDIFVKEGDIVNFKIQFSVEHSLVIGYVTFDNTENITRTLLSVNVLANYWEGQITIPNNVCRIQFFWWHGEYTYNYSIKQYTPILYTKKELFSQIDEFSETGDMYFDSEQYVDGVLNGSTGAVATTGNNRYRIVSPYYQFNYPMTIKVTDNAFRFYVAYYTNKTTITSSPGWKTSWTIPANQLFRLQIARVSTSEVNTEIANIEKFIKKISYTSKFKQDINEDLDEIRAAIGGTSFTNYSMGTDLIRRKLSMSELGMLQKLQAFCVYNGYYYSIDGDGVVKQDSSFNIVSSATLSLGHGNSFQLGSSHYAYASGWDDQNIYVVDLDTLTISDTITLPTTGYTSAVVDDVNEIAYIFQRDSYPDTKATYNYIVYDYGNENVLLETTLPEQFAALQGMDLYQGKIIAINGLANNPSGTENGYRVYNLKGELLTSFVLGDIESKEPEGICINRSNGEMLLMTNDKQLYKVF